LKNASIRSISKKNATYQYVDFLIFFKLSHVRQVPGVTRGNISTITCQCHYQVSLS